MFCNSATKRQRRAGINLDLRTQTVIYWEVRQVHLGTEERERLYFTSKKLQMCSVRLPLIQGGVEVSCLAI